MSEHVRVEPMTYHGPGWHCTVWTDQYDEDGDQIAERFCVWAPVGTYPNHTCAHRSADRVSWSASGVYSFVTESSFDDLVARLGDCDDWPRDVVEAFIETVRAAD